MKRSLSALCLFVALIVSADSVFAQARSPVTTPRRTPPAPTVAPEEYIGTFEYDEVKHDAATIGGVRITYNGKGTESARQAGINHERGVKAALADRQTLVQTLPKKIVEKEVVRYVKVPAEPAVIYVHRPVHVYHGYRWGWTY